MKLYTEEMFLQAAEKCEVSMIDAKHIMKYIDEYVTPIELPSEISDNVLFEQATVAMEEIYGSGCSEEIDSYFRGLKWMQKQIQGGNNEQ